MELEFPQKMLAIFEPHRYKVFWGGRGSSKSWSIARALLLKGYQKKIRVLCARELMNSIAESVHYLLSSQIENMGLQSFYEVQNATIIGKNGTEFVFAALKHNVSKIKSYESVDICWVEEAQTVSKTSWDTLIPTIRKDGSEIWISFNPDLETDETYKRFVANPYKDALVVKVNHSDNPWFPDELRMHMEELKERDYDAYLNVYEGHCRQNLEGSVYAKELREATEKERIGRVPYDEAAPVHVFFDLGWSDCTSAWFVQHIAHEYHVIDCYQNRQEKWSHYLGVLQQRGYFYDTIWLPHDAKAKNLQTGRSIEELTMAAYPRRVQIVPKLSVEDGINALRTIFSRMYFDAEKCADGIQALRHYRYSVDQDTGQFSKKPLHDEHSHYADAARAIAISITEKKKPKTETKEVQVSPNGRFMPNVGWMGV